MTISHLNSLCLRILSFFILLVQSVHSENFPFPGEKPSDPGFHAFVGGDIQVSPNQRIKNGILLIKDGKIEKIGTNITYPNFYQEWNCSGKTIYPGLIDPYLLTGEKNPALLSLGHQGKNCCSIQFVFPWIT